MVLHFIFIPLKAAFFLEFHCVIQSVCMCLRVCVLEENFQELIAI